MMNTNLIQNIKKITLLTLELKIQYKNFNNNQF